jgi:RHS repeat-associated protein
MGEKIGASNYFYTKDHLGSIREVTDSAGARQAHYDYDSYGVASTTLATVPSDFQYAGYYTHARSGLNLTLNRAYKADLGRWINRDPIEEAGGINLYAYVENSPINFPDPSGLGGPDEIIPNVPVPEEPVPGGHLTKSAHADSVKLAADVTEGLANALYAGNLLETSIKSIKSLIMRIKEHQEKLCAFKANPGIRPGMENQTPELINKANAGRVQKLELEIKKFEKEIEKILKKGK